MMCPTLCDPMDCGPPGSLVRRISQAKEYWSWLAFLSPGDLADPGIKPTSAALAVDSLPLSHQGSLLMIFTYFIIKLDKSSVKSLLSFDLSPTFSSIYLSVQFY